MQIAIRVTDPGKRSAAPSLTSNPTTWRLTWNVVRTMGCWFSAANKVAYLNSGSVKL